MTGEVKPWKIAAAAAMVLCGIGFLLLAMSRTEAANRDFICYWASGRQLLHHANPYDGPAILKLEHAAGYTGDRPFLMRNPPTFLLAVLPMGLMPERAGAIAWVLILVAVLMLSVKALWPILGGGDDRSHLTAYMFPPVIGCVMSGQIGILLLGAAVLFLLAVPKRPFLAGLALATFAVKPHLYLPFAAALVAWSFFERRWSILAGAVCGAGLLVLAGLALDPHGWAQYAAMIRQEGIEREFVPSISVFIRSLFAPQKAWVQIVPSLLGCVWAVVYYWRHRRAWSWVEQGPFLLLVSVTTAPYAWFTDQCLALPAVMGSFLRQGHSAVIRNLYLLCAEAGIVIVFLHPKFSDRIFVLLSPVWLGFCMYARSKEYAVPPGSDEQNNGGGEGGRAGVAVPLGEAPPREALTSSQRNGQHRPWPRYRPA